MAAIASPFRPGHRRAHIYSPLIVVIVGGRLLVAHELVEEGEVVRSTADKALLEGSFITNAKLIVALGVRNGVRMRLEPFLLGREQVRVGIDGLRSDRLPAESAPDAALLGLAAPRSPQRQPQS
jgi:hypothetical protein